MPSTELLQHASYLLKIGKAEYERALAAGENPELVEFMKEVTYVWLYRWRRQWGLTWRSVTLVHKVSQEKAIKRFKVYWYNVLAMRFFHQALFGPGKLRFLSVDEKTLLI